MEGNPEGNGGKEDSPFENPRPKSELIPIPRRIGEDDRLNDNALQLSRYWIPADTPPSAAPSPGWVSSEGSRPRYESEFSSGPGLEFYMSRSAEIHRGKRPIDPRREQISRQSFTDFAARYSDNKPDDRIMVVTGGHDRRIRLWDSTTGENYRTIINKGCHMNRLMITRNKRFIAAAGYRIIHLYELNSSRRHGDPFRTYYGHEDNVTSMDFHPSGNWMVTGSEDRTVRLWDLREQLPYQSFAFPDAINSVKLHPCTEEEIFCAGELGRVRILDLRKNQCSLELEAGEVTPSMNGPTAVKSMDVSWDGNLLVAANAEGMFYLWNLRREAMNGFELNTKGRLFAKVQAHGKHITKCCFSPELSARNLLATCSADETLKLWEVTPANVWLDKTLVGHTKWVWDCAFSKDGSNLLSASSDTTANLWDAATGAIVQTYRGPAVKDKNPNSRKKDWPAFAMTCCAFYDSDPVDSHCSSIISL